MKTEFKKFEIKKASLTSINGGTSTTLKKKDGTYIEVGFHAENEHEDTNGDGKWNDGDKDLGLQDIVLGITRP